MLFSDLYKITASKVIFVGFRGAIAPIAPPGSAPAVVAPVWINSVFCRCPDVRCREEYIYRNELSFAK